MDARIEAQVGKVLSVGVIVSSAALALGLALALVMGQAYPPARLLLSIGLIVLMATPVARVAFSAVAFAWTRDWLFATLAGIVFVVLMGSIVLGVG
ncbi:MAG: DUF1634 domain-containing protein [Vicinamibacterales bacterium]